MNLTIWKKVFSRPAAGILLIFALACALTATGPNTKVATADHGTPGQSFLFLQPGFTQELFGATTTTSILGGVAFAPDGDPVVSECFQSGAPIHRFDHQGVAPVVHNTNLHPQSVISNTGGCGLTNHPDGNLYANTTGGVIRLDAVTGALIGGPFGPSGNALGIAPDPQTGNLVYVGGNGIIHFVNSSFTTSGDFSSVTVGGDGIAFDPTGNFLFISTGAGLAILNRTGALVRNVSASGTDGISFHAEAPKFVLTNNIDGTMTRFDFPNDDFTQAPSQSVFASGGFRGDLTQVGPDGCLYVTQNGTRYNDGTVTNENSLVRICGGFAPPPGVGGCEISCPPNITRNADPRQCTTVVTYTLPTSRGDCDEGTRPLASNRVATCDPPPGSRFPVGDTTVTCTVTGTTQTARCSFTVTVTDNTPPVIACPPDQTVAASSNQCGGVANYATPPATDNCGGAAIVCAPPSGTPLPTGSSEVRCVARDDVGNESVCSFRVVVQDKELPKVVCPDSRTVEASASSCLTAVPGLALPSATDNCSGTVRVIFTRSDGKTNLNDPFSPGDTIITYTAIDASGNPSLPCQQTIRVNAAPKLVLPTEVNFGKVDFLVAAKKKPKKRAVTLADSTRTFTIRNDGCGDAVLTLKSINRTGSDVANNKITNTDDSDFFSVREIGGGFKTPKGDNTIRIPANPNNPSAQRKDIEIIVQPRLPERSASNSGLSTKQALPDPFTAELVFMDSAGATYRVALKASVSNDVRFINPEDIQRKAPFISFSKAGDIFTVEYTLYDADTGGKQANSASFVKSAKYEFLDDGGKVVETINVDLAGPIEAADLAKGQRFKVTKTFSGASDNSSITRVRVTVTDGAASPSLEGGLSSGQASQSFSPAQAFDYTQDLTIHLSAERLERFK